MPSADPGPSAARRLNRPRAASTALAAVFSLAAVFLLGLSGAGAARSGELPSRGEVNAIVEGLRADPDLKTTRRARILHFKQTEQKAPPPWWDQSRRWTAEAFAWLAATSRWLIWLLGALAVALILLSVRRWSKERADAEADPLPPLPSHVGILDVRPESLPDRIGAHARSLWQRGEQLATECGIDALTTRCQRQSARAARTASAAANPDHDRVGANRSGRRDQRDRGHARDLMARRR